MYKYKVSAKRNTTSQTCLMDIYGRCLVGIFLSFLLMSNAYAGPLPDRISSYTADNQCFCIQQSNIALSRIIVPTPIGGQSVEQVCDRLGKGPRITLINGLLNYPVYTSAQCGNGPTDPSTIADTKCPELLTLHESGCVGQSSIWTLANVFKLRKPLSISTFVFARMSDADGAVTNTAFAQRRNELGTQMTGAKIGIMDGGEKDVALVPGELQDSVASEDSVNDDSIDTRVIAHAGVLAINTSASHNSSPRIELAPLDHHQLDVIFAGGAIDANAAALATGRFTLTRTVTSSLARPIGTGDTGFGKAYAYAVGATAETVTSVISPTENTSQRESNRASRRTSGNVGLEFSHSFGLFGYTNY